MIKLNQFEALVNRKTDTTYVINFWATWCKPCVKELPGFREVEEKAKGSKTRFIYVSLDFKRQLPGLNNFLKENNFFGEVYLIDEPDYDLWINKVHKDWQGNIPATLIYNYSNDIRVFYPNEMEKSDLEEALVKIMQQ